MTLYQVEYLDDDKCWRPLTRGYSDRLLAEQYIAERKEWRADFDEADDSDRLRIVEDSVTAKDKQRAIDISNLRFYAELFRHWKWETPQLHWTLFETTLRSIADRIEESGTGLTEDTEK